MKKTKAIIILVMALVLTASPLAAGGSRENKGAETVTIWHCAQGANADVFNTLVDTFNSTIGKEKGIVIDSIYQGKAADVLTGVNAASAAGNLPDIAMMDATAATDMNHSDYIVTVGQLGIDTTDILPCGISSYTSEKGLLALPFNASALLYYYNKTLYDSLGVKVPETLDEMAEVAAVVGSTGVTAFAGVPATFELSTFIGAQNGLSYMVNNRNGHDGAPTEVLFGKEGTYAAFLEKWKELYDTGYYNPLVSGVTGEFTSGRCAAMLASSSNLSTIIHAVDGAFEVGVAKVPIVNEQATGGTVISGGALFTFTDNEAVRTVLDYLISPDSQVIWAQTTGYVPVNMRAYESSGYKAFLKENPLYTVAYNALLDSNPGLANVWVPSAYSIYYSFQANVAAVLEGKDIDTAVAEMEAIVQNAIDTFAAQNN